MDSQCQPELASPVVAGGRGGERVSSWTLTAAGSTARGAAAAREGWREGKKRETDGKDEKAEKITHKANRWRMKGWRVLG